jgi:hypothetical protein
MFIDSMDLRHDSTCACTVAIFPCDCDTTGTGPNTVPIYLWGPMVKDHLNYGATVNMIYENGEIRSFFNDSRNIYYGRFALDSGRLKIKYEKFCTVTDPTGWGTRRWSASGQGNCNASGLSDLATAIVWDIQAPYGWSRLSIIQMEAEDWGTAAGAQGLIPQVGLAAQEFMYVRWGEILIFYIENKAPASIHDHYFIFAKIDKVQKKIQGLMIGKHIGVVNGNYYAPNKIRLRVLLRASTPAYEWNFDITDLDGKLAPDLDQGTPEKNILKATIGHDMTHSYSFQSLWAEYNVGLSDSVGYKLENFTVNLENVYTATWAPG